MAIHMAIHMSVHKGLSDELQARDSIEAVPVNDFSRRTESIHLYTSMVVMQKRPMDAMLFELVAGDNELRIQESYNDGLKAAHTDPSNTLVDLMLEKFTPYELVSPDELRLPQADGRSFFIARGPITS